ncbi:hypothetical protein [Actinomadura sp. DC4]|uniref:hypothetical protein n=1 Tax=Actinomadura sp. DC4 TaxID=3055069 RepID=UPI0025AF6E7E|nr:hypothetical protein [Actinomadura sp. DC4]MDN3355113.1 hypothetical protein [Actinomadura sp. DC4]
MATDRASDGTDTNAETTEAQPDRRPPPPADRPGTDGYPSRAESRDRAAAANETSTQNTEKPADDKADTSHASQETSGEQGSNATEKPEPPGTPESNEGTGNDGAGKRDDYGPSQENTEARSDTAPPSDGVIGSTKETDRREQLPDGQSAPDDGTTSPETDKQPVSAIATERPEDEDTGKPLADDDSTRMTDRSVEALADEEAAADTDDASSSGAKTLARRFESLDEADPGATDERSADVKGTTDEGTELTLQGDSTSERTEPTWATGGLDIAGILPTGEELVKMENDKQSRAERARRKMYESGEEVLDDVGKVVNRIDQIFQRPPAGHPETRTGPEAVPAPHDGINAADTVTALIAAGVVVGEVYRRGRERLKQKKGV